MRIKVSIIVGVVFGLWSNAFAQIDTTTRYSESVIVIAGFDPVISDAFKISDRPVLRDTTVATPRFTYDVVPLKVPIQFQPLDISPARVTGEPLTKLYRNLIKAGFGNYTTPYLDVHLMNTRSSKFALGANYRHLSSSGKIKEYAYAGYSDNDATLFGKYLFNKFTMDAGFDYKRKAVHFYGFKPEENPEYSYTKNDIKHVLNYYGASAVLTSNNVSPKAWQHRYGLKYHYFNDNYRHREIMGGFDGNVAKNMKLFKFSNNDKLNIDFSADYLNNKMDTLALLDNSLIKISPSLTTKFKEYQLSLGFKSVVRNQTGSTSDFLFFPTIDARIILVPRIISVFAGLDGDVNRYSFYELADINPFMNPFVNLTYEVEKMKIYGGLQSNFSKQLGMRIEINTSQVEGMLFFLNDTSNLLMNHFNTVEDDLSKVNVNADISFVSSEKLSFNFRTSYFQYSNKNELNPWHMPSMVHSLTSFYNMQDKIIIRVDGLITMGRLARIKDIEGNMLNKSLKTSVDFNLGVEYRYTKLLSAFLNINNISANRNYYFYQYPSQRINFIVGISYSFGGDLSTFKRK
ncbi:MAG: hypothetical protein PHI36_00455 [Bacteroidales bacterium]|nr:hypothetical protein [Bacteroidales bacterium]MDD4574876.1 hypothetical protein [Bacteroidales bacterium]